MNQLFTDIDFLVDIMGCDADDCIDFLTACDDLGGISAEYFFEEFVFIPEDATPEDISRLHDPDYLRIDWSLN